MQPASAPLWRFHEPLATRTTLGVGGTARYFAEADNPAALVELLRAAAAEALPTFVLGGGSNVVVADSGFAGLVLRYRAASWRLEPQPDANVLVQADAGAVWDDVVAATAAAGLSGLECLSGIPGWVGAAPIQNIGAYGGEASHTVAAVHVLERATGNAMVLPAAACGFGYRHSHFNTLWLERFVVVQVDFRLRRGAAQHLTYPELRAALGLKREVSAKEQSLPEPAVVRAAVLELRRKKSMLYDVTDANHRSAGSFFVNPVVTRAQAAAVRAHVSAHDTAAAQTMPLFATSQADQVKLSAAWLIEQAGFRRGFAAGAVGLSSAHALAIINRGSASAAEVMALAAQIQQAVTQKFGIRLRPEPVLLGFASHPLL